MATYHLVITMGGDSGGGYEEARTVDIVINNPRDAIPYILDAIYDGAVLASIALTEN